MSEDITFKLDIGCSYHKKDGFIGIDILMAEGVDVIADACDMPFKENTFSEIYSSYALEHIQDNLSVISEMYRVCKSDAKILLILPHFSNPAFSDDLTHKHSYSTRTFEHYDQEMHYLTGHPNYLPEVDIMVVRSEMRWWPPQIIDRKSFIKRNILKFFNTIINRFANANHFFCERIWCSAVGGFYEVEYLIIVRK